MNIINSEKLTAGVEHQLMMLSTPRHIIKPGYPKSKWYDLDGLKDTPTTRNFRMLYEKASALIDKVFFEIFDTYQSANTDAVIFAAINFTIHEANRQKHEYPRNEWKFMVMVTTLLRCRHLMVKKEEDPRILEAMPEFWRQYGFLKMGLEEVMLYYADTEKMMKRHQKIYVKYVDENGIDKHAEI